MHCSPHLDEDEISNTAEPAARPCGECQQRLHLRNLEAGHLQQGREEAAEPGQTLGQLRSRFCAMARQDVVEM